MLQASGIGHVLIGHSERRQHFGETSESAARRALSLLEQGIQVLFCVGETLSEREKDHTARTLEEQMAPLVKGLQSIEPGRLSRLNLAYEPVWAIGTGRTASPDQANEAHRILHEICAKRAPNFHPRILYGGSVTPENFSELLRQPGIDGGLVGGGSLKPDTFSKLLKILLEAR
jgi:triosephosphate isomerase